MGTARPFFLTPPNHWHSSSLLNLRGETEEENRGVWNEIKKLRAEWQGILAKHRREIAGDRGDKEERK